MKEQIIQGAITLFKRDGYEFKVDDLAKMLHISKKTIYKLFGSKEGIYREFIVESFRSVHENQNKIFNNDALTNKEKLIAILNSSSKFESEISIDDGLKIAEIYPALGQLIMETYKTQWDKVSTLIEKEKLEGNIRSEVDTTILITLFMEGMQMMHRDDVLLRTGKSYRQAIREVSDIILNGIYLK